jgi:hypothetical protein
MLFDPLDGLSFAVKFHALKLPIGKTPRCVVFFAFHVFLVHVFVSYGSNFKVQGSRAH